MVDLATCGEGALAGLFFEVEDWVTKSFGDLSVGTKGSQASSRIQAVLIDTYHC